MNADAILDALADMVADRVADRLAKTPRSTWYTRACLPPGAASWRAARETAARSGIATIRVGRDVMIDAAAWDARLSQRTRRTCPPTATNSDAAALEAMGVRLRVVGGSR